nr:retrovirus-related Pol polyprotein from transposon TNT 1-94 [Tanacetum cinerariifolium]
MSRDLLIVGSTMRIPLLFRGEYSQWSERFVNYLKEQPDGEAMINLIKNGDQPLPTVIQVSIARATSSEQPPLKDKSIWSDQEKKIQKIDHLARSILIQWLPNDIYSLIDSNKTTKDLWDALEKHMLGFKYGEQDRKATILYDYETFKATEGELLLDNYIRYLQVINDLKKCGYSKDNRKLNFKFLNNLQPEWKQYETIMRQNKNLLDINIDALYSILKQNPSDVNDAMKSKKKAVMITSDPLALVAEQTKVRKRKEKVVVSSESEGSDDELKKITALLAKAFNRKKFYSKPTNNNLRTSSTTSSANKKQEYVKYDDKKEEKKVDEKKKDMSKVKCYNCKKEGHFAKDCKKAKVKDYEYYKSKMLLTKKDKDEQVLLAKDHAWMESSSDSDQEINYDMVFMAQMEKVLSDSEKSSSSSDDTIVEKQIADQEILFDKMGRKLVELDENIVQICLWIIDSGCSKYMTDTGTEFKNKTLAKFFNEVGISQQFSAARTPQQNGIVERRNRSLVKAARTMLTFANLSLFLWAEAIVTAYFTQNRLIIHKSFDKTPYELINKRKPNIKVFHVFRCRCYLLNDYDDVEKLKAKGDIRVFVGCSKESAAFRVYNKCTQKIHESMNVNFDEISEMASKQFSLEPGLSNLNETSNSFTSIRSIKERFGRFIS